MSTPLHPFLLHCSVSLMFTYWIRRWFCYCCFLSFPKGGKKSIYALAYLMTEFKQCLPSSLSWADFRVVLITNFPFPLDLQMFVGWEWTEGGSSIDWVFLPLISHVEIPFTHKATLIYFIKMVIYLPVYFLHFVIIISMSLKMSCFSAFFILCVC